MRQKKKTLLAILLASVVFLAGFAFGIVFANRKPSSVLTGTYIQEEAVSGYISLDSENCGYYISDGSKDECGHFTPIDYNMAYLMDGELENTVVKISGNSLKLISVKKGNYYTSDYTRKTYTVTIPGSVEKITK